MIMGSVNLERFKGFMKPKEDKGKSSSQPERRRIIGYTRVSTKRQIEGYSIEEQRENIQEFAKKQNYDLVDIIDGQYESAKTDFTRKEFKRLYETVIKMRPRPYAIAIKFISRFSRTGGGAISLVDDLIKNKGIHLLETSTGICTDTEDGEIEVYEKLIEAKKENKIRLDRTIPGMKKFLKEGNWLGQAPLGYDTYGKRVLDEDKLRRSQKIVLNENGEHLREAWKWKLLGWSNVDIKRELWDKYQMKVSIKQLSDIWHNPFYAGVCVNKMIDAPVQGNWEAIVSEADFFKINHKDDPLETRKYQSEGNINYPLAHFAICSKCGRLLVGYTNKKKGISYYKCPACSHNYNADTKPHSQNKGLNDAFVDMLSQYCVDECLKEALFDTVVEKMCGGNAVKEYLEGIEKQLKDIEVKEALLDDKYLFEGFPKDKYDIMTVKLCEEKAKLEYKRDEVREKSSNSVEEVKKAIDTICNAHIYWKLGDIQSKKKLQDMVFPKGINVNPETREVLTDAINPFFIIKPSNSTDYNNKKNENDANLEHHSRSVSGKGIEPLFRQ